MSVPVRVRFAPSPTGHLHVGGARTAIFNWLFARHHGGSFIVRVEDTDQARSTLESEKMVLDDLLWLGIQWDEGPDAGGPHAPYRQSERLDYYRRVADELLATGHVYRCFCDEEMLERKRQEAEVAGIPPHYDLTCLRLSAADVEARVRRGDAHVIRFHVPKEDGVAWDGDVTIQDHIRGEVTWRKESLGDFIILRSDGMPTYNFSVVADDHDMRITHVIRAEEHLTNTHRQVLIYRALNWPVPEFAHVSLILGQDRTKLSKRHGATSVSAYAEEGFLPDAMFNYLTLLGWSPPGGVEIFSRNEAIGDFSLERVNAAPAVFDPQKFRWMNGQYLSKLTSSELAALVIPHLERERLVLRRNADVERWVEEAIEAVRKGIDTLADFVPALRVFFEFEPKPAADDAAAAEALTDPSADAVIRALVEELERETPRDADAYHAVADRLKTTTGQKGKKLFMPVRIAVTGSSHGPELARMVPLLERGAEVEGLAPILRPVERAKRIAGSRG